jgi:predicted Rossmann-fold nucleotide-binding protein
MNSTDRPRIPVAYKNARFLETDDARPLRLLAEYLEPMHAFHREHVCDTIVFFGSARLARELARLVTDWSKSLPSRAHRYVVCTGGGGGLMEAANRGAFEAGGKTIGLNIGLPQEQRPNPYLTRGLTFEFRYFFMRKFWFAHLARALVVFPGGFPVVLYGSRFWNEIINFDALVRHGMISPEDLALFQFADDPATALGLLQAGIAADLEEATPAIARSCRCPD